MLVGASKHGTQALSQLSDVVQQGLTALQGKMLGLQPPSKPGEEGDSALQSGVSEVSDEEQGIVQLVPGIQQPVVALPFHAGSGVRRVASDLQQLSAGLQAQLQLQSQLRKELLMHLKQVRCRITIEDASGYSKVVGLKAHGKWCCNCKASHPGIEMMCARYCYAGSRAIRFGRCSCVEGCAGGHKPVRGWQSLLLGLPTRSSIPA